MYLNASELVLPAHVTITGSSVPNFAAVGSMIAEVQDELDAAAAGAGYAVPLTPAATIGYGQMVGYTKLGVTCKVLRVMFPNLPGGPGGRTTSVVDYCTEYQAALTLIRAGDVALVGAPTDSSGGGRQLPRSYSVSNPQATSGVVSQTTVGKQF